MQRLSDENLAELIADYSRESFIVESIADEKVVAALKELQAFRAELRWRTWPDEEPEASGFYALRIYDEYPDGQEPREFVSLPHRYEAGNGWAYIPGLEVLAWRPLSALLGEI